MRTIDNLKCIVATEEGLLEEIYGLRREVFVEELGVPKELEIDDLDAKATHAAALTGELVVGCGRVVIKNGRAKIGRVAVRKSHRKQGIGNEIMLLLIEAAKGERADRIFLHAQINAVPFYERLGFIKEGEAFSEAGISHVLMVYGR